MDQKAITRQLRELELLEGELRQRSKFNRWAEFNPYPWQCDFLGASSWASQVLLMAANRVGKTFTGAYNATCHLTGRYPDWWTGHKWEHPIDMWVAGVSAESTRDVIQLELVGPPENPDERGTGMIPLECIGTITRKPQVPNAIQSMLIKHFDSQGRFDGWSRLMFKAYEQGENKFMSSSVHEIWLDEQPPDSLFGQCITRTATTGGNVTMTFTPEDGVTQVVAQFTRDRKPGQALFNATWDDAPHLTEAVKNQLLAVYGEHERDMRSKGIPIFGSGPVFPVAEDQLVIDPFEIPDYWPMIAGLDIGWDHPTAVAWLRFDPDADTVYVVDEYRQRQETVSYHSTALHSRLRCPVAWPHDGYKHEGGSGMQIAQQYRAHGCNLLPQHFTNPLAPGDKGTGNYKVEPGINAMIERMQTGRFRVFRTCHQWLQEYRMYHREEGKIVDIDDDLMAATRYAHQSLRFSEVPTGARGFQQWMTGKIRYRQQEYLA